MADDRDKRGRGNGERPPPPSTPKPPVKPSAPPSERRVEKGEKALREASDFDLRLSGDDDEEY